MRLSPLAERQQVKARIAHAHARGEDLVGDAGLVRVLDEFTGHIAMFNSFLLKLMVFAFVVLGIALLAFLLTHLYMSLFAIKGAIQSMITGYKSKDEVDHLHSKYKYE